MGSRDLSALGVEEVEKELKRVKLDSNSSPKVKNSQFWTHFCFFSFLLFRPPQSRGPGNSHALVKAIFEKVSRLKPYY